MEQLSYDKTEQSLDLYLGHWLLELSLWNNDNDGDQLINCSDMQANTFSVYLENTTTTFLGRVFLKRVLIIPKSGDGNFKVLVLTFDTCHFWEEVQYFSCGV